MKYSTSFRFSSFLFSILFLLQPLLLETPTLWAASVCIYGMFRLEHGIRPQLLGGANGERVGIPNLPEWGIMGSGHNYFKNGDLDIFRLSAPCIPKVCSIIVTSDGSGGEPGWYLEYVEVTATRPNIAASGQTTHFEVDQWLGIDEPPYSLSASRTQC